MMNRMTPVVLNLIIINALVWFVQEISPISVTDWGTLHYFASDAFKPHQLITHMFMHDNKSILHLLFNMFALWMFGGMLENYIGSKRFLIFYLICGLGAALLTQLTIPFSSALSAKSAQGLQFAAENNLSIEQVTEYYKQTFAMLGASGAIMGVMAAFAYLFPNTEMIIMPIPIPIKAKYLIPFWVLIDLFGGIRQAEGDNIGHFAHLGGAIVGLILIIIWNKNNRKTFY